jgi:hypothetical protein
MPLPSNLMDGGGLVYYTVYSLGTCSLYRYRREKGGQHWPLNSGGYWRLLCYMYTLVLRRQEKE